MRASSGSCLPTTRPRPELLRTEQNAGCDLSHPVNYFHPRPPINAASPLRNFAKRAVLQLGRSVSRRKAGVAARPPADSQPTATPTAQRVAGFHGHHSQRGCIHNSPGERGCAGQISQYSKPFFGVAAVGRPLCKYTFHFCRSPGVF